MFQRWLSHSQAAKQCLIASAWCDVQHALGASDDYSNYTRDKLLAAYYLPLLVLLREYAQSGRAELKLLFIEELYRYVLRTLPHEQQTAYLARLISGFIQRINEVTTDAAFAAVSKILADVQDELTQSHSGQRLSMVAVGDCLMTDIRAFLRHAMLEQQLPLDVHCLYFGAAQDKLAVAPVLAMISAQKADLLALSFLTYDGLPIYRLIRKQCKRFSEPERQAHAGMVVDIMERFIQQIRQTSDIPILLHNVGGLPLGDWRQRALPMAPFSSGMRAMIEVLNQHIEQLCQRVNNCLLIDEAAIIRTRGARTCARSIVPPSIRKTAFFHRSVFGYYVSEEYAQRISAFSKLRAIKLILVDFDNTLWRGVMADGAVAHFSDRQRLLKRLKEQGILLVALSKNTESNIRWSEMQLARDDFVLLKVNWNSKPQSIQEVAAELNLGKNSFLLLDDNPVERELVRIEHPMVLSLDPEEEKTWRWLALMFDFPCTNQTEESRQRTELYRSQAKRSVTLKNSAVSHASLMASLGLQMRFRLALGKDLARVHELAQRTNQFNTTTLRYEVTVLQKMMGALDKHLYVAELSDKFGNLGLVALAVVAVSPDARRLESFVMSCRAMGFGLEKAFLAEIVAAEQWPGAYLADFIATDRNQPAASFYSDSGFNACTAGWILPAGQALLDIPTWFQVSRGSLS